MHTFDYAQLAKRYWDSEILGLVAQIHEYKGRNEQYLQQKPTELDRLIELAKVQNTEASNAIEGIHITNTHLMQLCADKTTPRNRDEEEIMGYRDVLNTIHESYPYIPIKANYILQLHRDLYKYSEKGIGGRFKNTQNFISTTDADGNSFVLFTPLAPYDTPVAVDAICDSLNRELDAQSINALILIPTFIHDFLCIHPFNDGNGRMSRLLTTLLLYRSGYMVGKYISLESKIVRNKQLYYDALEKAGLAGMRTRKTRLRSSSTCCGLSLLRIGILRIRSIWFPRSSPRWKLSAERAGKRSANSPRPISWRYILQSGSLRWKTPSKS